MHRDFKTDNCFVDKGDILILGDFGMAKGGADQLIEQSFKGSPLAMAPEVLEERPYNNLCDMWSLGVCLYQMLFGVGGEDKESREKCQEYWNKWFEFDDNYIAKVTVSRGYRTFDWTSLTDLSENEK